MQVLSSSCAWLLFGSFPLERLQALECHPGFSGESDSACPAAGVQGWHMAGSVENRPKGCKQKRDSLLFSFGFFVSAVQSDESTPGEMASCPHHPRSSASHADSHSWVVPTTALFPWTSF